MWATGIFVAMVAAGIAFLLCFLGALIREQAAHRSHQVHVLEGAPDASYRLRFGDKAVLQPAPGASLRVVWQVGPGREAVRKEPSCGISSSC